MENKNNILVERKESIIFQLDKKQNVGNGWIGGNAPVQMLRSTCTNALT